MSHDHDGQHPPPPEPVFLFLGREARQLRQSHRERVFDVAWSENGSLLATASEANEVRLWAAPAGEGNDGPPSLLCPPLEHEAEVLRVAWRTGDAAAQPSSTLLASATATGRVRLYRVAASELQDGEEGREVDVQVAASFAHRGEGQVYALHWVGPRQPGGAGSELMTALDDKVHFWDVARGGGPAVAAKWEFQTMPGATTTFGGAARNPNKTCFVFDAAHGCLNAQQGNGSPVVCLALSDGSVRIHDRRSARPVATLRRSASAHLTSLCLAPEEGVLVACGGRGEATVYDTRNFAVRAVLQGHTRPCFGAQVVPRFVAKRHYMASRPTASADPETPPPLLMTFSSDSCITLHDLSASSSSSQPPQQPLPPLAPVAATPHRDFPIYCAAFSPEGSTDRPVRLVLGGGEGQQEEHQHGGEACSGHGHDHHHHEGEGCGHEGEAEASTRTLLCYVFA